MKVLFLCVANSARSQIAEGLAKKLLGSDATVQSAGSFPCEVHYLAIEVMKEIGIDITDQYSKSVNSIDPDTVDTVVTLCSQEVCPTWFSKSRKYHWPIKDPVAYARTQEDQLEGFRKIRDEIQFKILSELKTQPNEP